MNRHLLRAPILLLNTEEEKASTSNLGNEPCLTARLSARSDMARYRNFFGIQSDAQLKKESDGLKKGGDFTSPDNFDVRRTLYTPCFRQHSLVSVPLDLQIYHLAWLGGYPTWHSYRQGLCLVLVGHRTGPARGQPCGCLPRLRCREGSAAAEGLRPQQLIVGPQRYLGAGLLPEL